MKLIECPRDAMQGLHDFIPTAQKTAYINQLLKVGFDTLDFGSFVSPKAIPQLRDTQEVLAGLDLSNSNTKLLAIVANLRGAEAACNYDEIRYLGFPFSISETFQQRNTNSSIAESLERVKRIQELALKNNKEVVIYISMAFGNPYGDPWNSDIAIEWTNKLVKDIGIQVISLSDTIGVSNPENINYFFNSLIPAFPAVEFGAHLHTTPDTWLEKVEAAWNSGCRRLDSALKGYGGCPMADDELVGNMATENVLHFLHEQQIESGLDQDAFAQAMLLASQTFPQD